MRYHIIVNMRINNSSNQNKKRIIAVIAILLIALAAGLYFLLVQINAKDSKSNTSTSSTNLDPATDEQKAAGDQAKDSTANSSDTSSNSSKNEDQSDPTASSSTVNVQTTASSQNGTTYQLRYLIDTVASDLTCTLTITNGSKSITKTSKTQALAQSSTCQGFDISTSEISPGTWQATLVISGNKINGNTTNTIQVQ